jgi:hypothetical protein
MKKKEFLTEAKRKAIIAEKEKAIIESFSKTFNKIKRIDENEINEINEINDNDDDLYVELNHKDIVSIYLNDESLTFVMGYKIKTDVYYDISKGEPQTYWHPGESAGLEDVDVNLDVNAMQLDEYGNEIGVVELPDSHYDAIVKAIEEDIEYGYENRKDTLYYKYDEPDGEPEDYDY